MTLIARKPCSFGGQNFFIGDEVPDELVASPKTQEQLGILAIASGEVLHSKNDGAVSENMVMISVKTGTDGEEAQNMSVPATSEDIQQVFSIMQLTAEEGVKEIANVTSENALILLHAADSRKTIKNAAKERADNLFSANGDFNEAGTGNEPTNTDTEGAGT